MVEPAYIERDFGDRPFLRWAGGKQHLRRKIVERLPLLLGGGRYFEPFLGAAAVFLALAPPTARLSDLNAHLVDTYRAIRDDWAGVAQVLTKLAANHSPKSYYKVRDDYNVSRPGAARAAKFIYLNRSGYNGVFRVNRRGEFNVPIGNKNPFSIPSAAYLRRLSGVLQRAELGVLPYEVALDSARSGDIVYLDPPYPPLNGTSFFRHYTKDRFDDEDQRAVAAAATRLRHKGCFVAISNADTPEIRSLYATWKVEELSVPRWVMSGSRHRVQELLITSS